MTYPRRRHQYRHRLVPAISAVSAAILILFVYISFLVPSPIDSDHIHLGSSSRRMNNDAGERNEAPVFHVRNKAATITHANRYLAIATGGGLNQQRTGGIQKDCCTHWIFDVDWFMSYLEDDVKVIKELPRRRGRIWSPYTMRVPRKCNEHCYISRLLPVLLKKHAVQLTKFDYRLSNRLSMDLQKLRCRVNYHALKFTEPILEMGVKLVQKIRMKSKHYIALHLRFEPDMLASQDVITVGEKKRGGIWLKYGGDGKPYTSPNPDRERRQGRCPLTPEEVGLLLRALGYDRETHIFLASEKYMEEN
ncbi:hypothetical protein OROGR_021526 [Orobanche gracilis]